MPTILLRPQFARYYPESGEIYPIAAVNVQLLMHFIKVHL